MIDRHHILLTIDVEDWFQVENFKPWIPFSSWSSHELRVEKNTHRILNLLDSVELQPSAISHQPGCSRNPKATFFVLGWIAKRLPHLVREIQGRGHEVASHGYYHTLCEVETPEALKRDLTDTKKLLEDILGAPVFGFRAPSFSISHEILKVIADCGYLYDSSYNSFAMHGRYGRMDFSQNGNKGIAFRIPTTQEPAASSQQPAANVFFELPISNWQLGQHVAPWGGGAYFRLIPSPLFKLGVRSILKDKGAYLFYMHPWEIDPKQPRVDEAPSFFKFRHYTNLGKTESKLSSLFDGFNYCSFTTCYDYLLSYDRSLDNAQNP
jgi:polysaccharide deacetylase family protein (PEP-CTERM system associated)